MLSQDTKTALQILQYRGMLLQRFIEEGMTEEEAVDKVNEVEPLTEEEVAFLESQYDAIDIYYAEQEKEHETTH